MSDDKELLINVKDDKSAVTMDDAIELTGGCGRYQVFMQLVVAFFSLFNAYQTLLLYFTADDPPWRCKQNSTSTFCVANPNRLILFADIDFTQRCKMPRQDWEYTKSKSYSMVTEFDLICGEESLQSLIKSVFYIGWGVAGLFIGILADTFGRKLMTLFSASVLAVSSVVCVYATSVWQIIILRTLIGAGYGCVNTCLYILLSEICSIRYRSLSAQIYQLPFIVSLFSLIGVAYLEPHWRQLTKYTAIPGVFGLILYVIVFESPRWLLSKGRTEKARTIMKKIGSVNKTALNDEVTLTEMENKIGKVYSYIDLFRSCRVVVIVICLAYLWFACGGLYYGLAYAASSLGGDMHTDLVYMSLPDIPSSFIAMYLPVRFGRKRTIMGNFALCAVFLYAITAIPNNYAHAELLKTVFALIGKFCAALAFNVMYLWSFEIYPTVVRTQGFSVCQAAGRVGSASSPFIATNLELIFNKLPFIVFGTIGIIGLLMACFLPETKDKPTRESFEDFFMTNSLSLDEIGNVQA